MSPAHPKIDAQADASDPRVCAFVEANAGSGKTYTLVQRVARLLLAGARPEAILCVTFTKAAAAEMQSRLFDRLGGWAVMKDLALEKELAKIGESGRDHARARALFARALETPGGLKIQTLHAFCERLLRRFPLEAGVSPGFRVLDDTGAAALSTRARDETAMLALQRPDSLVGRAYAHLAVELDWDSFNGMLSMFEGRRRAISAYIDACGGDVPGDVWRRCGLPGESSCAEIEAQAVGRIRWIAWRRAVEGLSQGSVQDVKTAETLRALGPESAFTDIWRAFSTAEGEPRKRMATQKIDLETTTWLGEEQGRLHAAAKRVRSAKIAEATVRVLILAQTYASFYEDDKARVGALDFGDLVALSVRLLTERADAAWVLYKLDGGIDHLLLDEAQDTAPEQWDILRALTEEFFTGQGAGPTGRTVFAVGDAKQSIFSFQGADPERLAIETQAFRGMALDAQAPFKEVKLMESFRSTGEILKMVDQVFAGGPALAGVRPARGANVERLGLRHVARRLAAETGRVDLWPLEAGAPGAETDPWEPVDAEPETGAPRRLARRIADQITDILAKGYAVWDRHSHTVRRAVPGDILILVRRRNALFHEIIRALKRAGVAVGGPDRLELSEHGAFQDLTALAAFALFPGDDLALAGLLRGPFCSVDEESLFDLAHGRRGSLWDTLRRRAGERPTWREAAELLEWARGTLVRSQPFDGFSRVLARLDAQGRSMRQRLLTRLSAEGEDALEAFLGLTLEAEGQGVRDLESLLARVAGADQQIKRDPEAADHPGGGEVRVMTTHGAKGLEAAIVILPDTSTRATARGSPLLDLEGDGFAWAPRKDEDCEASAAARQRREDQTTEESARLLYVALTRPRDWLIIAGVETLPHFLKGSWRAFAEEAFEGLETRPVPLPGGGEARRFGSDPVVAPLSTAAAAPESPPPDWIAGLAPAEAADRRPASPSALIADEDDSHAPSPLTGGGLGRYRRGDLIHSLLQRLPDLAPGARAAAAQRLLARERDLTPTQRSDMAAAALAVLDDPRFAPVFGPGSRAEVAVAGAAATLPHGMTISGRIDRLLIEPTRVLIVDFKTNRPAPNKVQDADPAYVAQMAAYRAVLAEVYPDRTIEAALVWTDGPRLMALPADLMDAALARLAQ